MVTVQKYTIDDYFRFAERVAGGFEYVEGQILTWQGKEVVENILDGMFDDRLLSERATPKHDRLVSNIHGLLGIEFKKKKLPFLVYSQGTIIRSKVDAFRLPDVVVVGKDNEIRNKNHAIQNPIVLFEVLSKSTAKIDQTDKLEEYQNLETVADYLMIAQDKIRITHYTRIESNHWEERIYTQISENIYIKALDITLSVEDLYENI
jgi:Uma2 family endonuclease